MRVIHAELDPPYALNRTPRSLDSYAESDPFSALNQTPPKPIRFPITDTYKFDL